jgi:hypothetical protein
MLSAMNDEQEFDYRGYRVRIAVRAPAAESDTGVMLATTTAWPVAADGTLGEAISLGKNFQGIYREESAALAAAVTRAKACVDALANR